MVQQFIHGTQYIDELVMVRVKDKGDLYVHQDANWNVIGTTDLGRKLVERYVYSPYGELTVHQSTGYGDRDGDGDVDSTDKGTVGTTCTGTVSGACRILDLDFDGDYDANDATKFDALPQGLQRTPGRLASAVQQPFAHQGLLFEPEIGSYQNRARQYDPEKRRFSQRDPLFIGILQSTSPKSTNMRIAVALGAEYNYTNNNPIYYTDSTGLICDGGSIVNMIRPYQCRQQGEVIDYLNCTTVSVVETGTAYCPHAHPPSTYPCYRFTRTCTAQILVTQECRDKFECKKTIIRNVCGRIVRTTTYWDEYSAWGTIGSYTINEPVTIIEETCCPEDT
jgi:RHS repeat-associated protein